VFSEPAGDDYGAEFVVKAAVFSSGHDANLSPPTMRTPALRRRAIEHGPADSNPLRTADIECLTAHDRMHGSVELRLGLADHVLARGPRRDVRQ
jgi:hypothetical protein